MSSLTTIIDFLAQPYVLAIPLYGQIDIMPYVSAAVVFIGLLLVFRLIQFVVVQRLEVLAQSTKNDVDDTVILAVKGINAFVFSLVALYIALLPFALPPTLAVCLRAVVLVAVVWQLIKIATQFIGYAVSRWVEIDADNDGEIDPSAATASDLIRLITGIVLWVFSAIFILSNLGIEVTSLIAGLGIGGIAVAFALQGVLSDLFASFSIYFDKPFRLGDFVVIGTDSGTVEKIGIKSTRIRTLQGQELVVSNAELTTARVENYKKMQKRRIVVTFGITYETPHDKVCLVNSIVEGIFIGIENTDLDRVHFTTFADSSLLFEVVYFVQSSSYNEYLNIQQAFNFALMEKFATQDIKFAYPTQMVYQHNI